MKRGKRKADAYIDSEAEEEHPADSLIVRKAADRGQVKQKSLAGQDPASAPGLSARQQSSAELAQLPVAVDPTGVTVIEDGDEAAGAQSRVQRLLRGPRYIAIQSESSSAIASDMASLRSCGENWCASVQGWLLPVSPVPVVPTGQSYPSDIFACLKNFLILHSEAIKSG